MVDITFHGCKIVEVSKKNSDLSGPFVSITIEDRKGGLNEIYFFMEDLSAFNEIKKPE